MATIDVEKMTAGRGGEDEGKKMKNYREEEFRLEGDVGGFTENYLIFVRDGSLFLRDPLANEPLFFLSGNMITLLLFIVTKSKDFTVLQHKSTK